MITKSAVQLSRHGISGFILLPLLAWFLISFFYIISDPVGYLPIFFYSPINVIFGMFFLLTSLYHLNFDVKYVANHSKINDGLKNIFMLFFDFLSILVAVAGVLSILQLHFMGIFIS